MLNYQRVWLIRTLHIHTSVKNEHGYLTYRKSPVLNFANQWKTSIDYKWVIFHSYVKLAKGNKRTGACLRCARYSPISFAVMKNCDVQTLNRYQIQPWLWPYMYIYTYIIIIIIIIIIIFYYYYYHYYYYLYYYRYYYYHYYHYILLLSS